MPIVTGNEGTQPGSELSATSNAQGRVSQERRTRGDAIGRAQCPGAVDLDVGNTWDGKDGDKANLIRCKRLGEVLMAAFAVLFAKCRVTADAAGVLRRAITIASAFHCMMCHQCGG